eukprot:470307-Amorphochlora_amoeboformis.AAC.1
MLYASSAVSERLANYIQLLENSLVAENQECHFSNLEENIDGLSPEAVQRLRRMFGGPRGLRLRFKLVLGMDNM